MFGKLKYKHDVSSIDLSKITVRPNLIVAQIHYFGPFYFFSLNLNLCEKIRNFNSALWVGKFVYPLSQNLTDVPPKNKLITNYKKNSVLLRTNKEGSLVLSVMPKSPQYSILNRIKQNIAYFAVRVAKKISPQKRNINLYFEKDCSRAEESAIRVFQQVQKSGIKSSHNYFILDSNAKNYQSLKQAYGKNVVKRFSFMHYLLLFFSSSFISSELSSHVVEVRVLSEKLLKKINSTPLYFLQHGIMFAKPVENPMAAGFYKKNLSFNLKKSVISSSLEAKEFYKMGYHDKDLMKTGLATLDFANLDKDADKIVFMPTYRFWEEKAVMNGQLTETTYYESIMEIIEEFEKRNLLNKLLITPHNKFAEYLKQYMPNYSHIICENPTIALRKGRIFITDYSSAIYDAIYRGAYPIFYWKDREYLIDHYQATPPVNDENAPGKIAMSPTELIEIIEKAIAKNYVLEPDNLKKYRQINEFHDGKNTQRIMKYLLDLKVL